MRAEEVHNSAALVIERRIPRSRGTRGCTLAVMCALAVRGLSWQVAPRTLTEALVAGGAEAKRAFDAMMSMKKIEVAKIEAARRG
jgi:hypothetical protein